MKKFLVSLIIGITLMAIGTTMLVFEIKEFKFVDNRGDSISKEGYKSYIFNVSKHDLDLTFKNSSDTSYEWVYDDSLENEVKIEVYGGIDHNVDVKDNKISILNDRSYNHDNDGLDGLDYFNRFIDGLKEKKVYVFDSLSNIVITSSYKNRDNVNINYE